MGSNTSKLSKKNIPQVELEFKKLEDHPGNLLRGYFIDCVAYESIDGEQYIICCTQEAGVYRYNIHKNKWSKFVEYPIEMTGGGARNFEFSLALDLNQRTLYIFPYSDYLYHVLHLETKQWQHYDGRGFYDTLSAPKILYIQSKIHIISAETQFYHFIHDTDGFPGDGFANQLTSSEKNKYKIMTKLVSSAENTRKFMVFYVDITKQILMFHPGYKNIWFCNVNDLEWKKSKIKLPFKDWEFMGIVYDSIVILIYYKRKQIWCLDLQQRQWFKSNKVTPVTEKYGTAWALRNDNVIHVIDVTGRVNHIVFKVKDIIPSDLSEKINLRYVMVISGFIRREIIKSDHFSVDIIELIVKFYIV